ncbi:MAG: CDP-glycerol--glycerophosphate glycerophosphotransferase [Lachnospiraceae bacterium]|nr:CDP-glycerol--glycerophosphate glycerophosphotransferase [Lachnospiraceae bacterium]
MNILLYIDPGTGSMLFAILIGIIGTLNYLLKNGIVKLRFLLSGGKKVETNTDKLPFVIFSDDKRYWNVFEPICHEFDRRGVDMVYMTASPDDPVLQNPYEHVKGEFIGKNNKAFARMNFLNAGIVLSTTPGLDVYQWKRSKDVQYYVHMQHAASGVSCYRMFGTDYYDAVMVSGEYQEKEIRELERIRNLPEKELVKAGIPYMDEMVKRLWAASQEAGEQERTVLLAPTWGKSGIFQKYGGRIIEVLLKTGYHIIVRPHPQSFTSEKEMLEKIMREYPESDQLEWNRDNDNFEVLKRADILISDFSGVIFEFSLVYDKPIIYADTEFDSSPYDAWWLDTPDWTFGILPRIGQKLTMDNLDTLKQMIDECIQDPKYAKGRQEAREETWEYKGEGTERTVEYLLHKYDELTQAGKGA